MEKVWWKRWWDTREVDIGRSWSIQWVHLVELLEGEDETQGRGRGIVPVHRRVPATNRGCIIHSLGYTRTGIALRPLCVCVVSEQYRPRESCAAHENAIYV